MGRFTELFYSRMGHNRLFGSKVWQYNAAAAFDEASRRIEESLKLSNSLSIEDREESKELYLSDLVALKKIPRSIRNLNHLEKLFLGYSTRDGVFHKGCIQLSDLSLVQHLKKIKYLNISGTNVFDLNPLKSLDELNEIDMENVPVISIEPLEHSPSLKNIFMSGSMVRDVSPIGKMPLALIGRHMLISIKNTPAEQSDPRLKLLSQFEIEKSSDEIRDYLTGNHPAFEQNSSLNRELVIREVAKISTVSFRQLDNIIFAENNNDVLLTKIDLRQEALEAISKHGKSLVSEMHRIQIPEKLFNRVNGYVYCVENSDSFLEIDSAMSFLKGSLRDKILEEACDAGFLEACRQLVTLHNTLRGTFLPHPEQLDEIVSAATHSMSIDVARETSKGLAELFSATELSIAFDDSVTKISNRFDDYIEAAKELPANDTGLKRTAVLMSAVLAALASFVTIQSWAVSSAGVAFLAKLTGLITRVLQSLGLL